MRTPFGAQLDRCIAKLSDKTISEDEGKFFTFDAASIRVVPLELVAFVLTIEYQKGWPISYHYSRNSNSVRALQLIDTK